MNIVHSASGQSGKFLQLLLRHGRIFCDRLTNLVHIRQLQSRNFFLFRFLVSIYWFWVYKDAVFDTMPDDGLRQIIIMLAQYETRVKDKLGNALLSSPATKQISS